jgi:heme/copper-type cytochrome/quinol oxidase subunit 3
MTDYTLERRRGFPIGWWGMAMLVASEAMLFACFIATYFYFRFRTDPWPPAGIPEPKVVVPLVLALVLAVGSVPVSFAARAAARGGLGSARRLVFLALVVQTGYFAMQVQLYSDDLHVFTPQDNAYGSIYFLLLGADHAHVAVGLLFDVWLILKLARGLTRYRVDAARAIAFYWIAVSVLTLVVTGTVLSGAAG